MAEITREEFKKIYDEKFKILLHNLESERVEGLKKLHICAFLAGFFIFCLVNAIFFISFFNSISTGEIKWDMLAAPIPALILAIIFATFINFKLISNFKVNFKKNIIPKLLSVYGNLYLSENKEIITLSEIKSVGLFPNASKKITDEVIIGQYMGCNFIIMEVKLLHPAGKRTSVDFQGFVVKFPVNKKFSGKTVIGAKGRVSKFAGFNNVELESIDFMKDRAIFSTDQIEARYILTTAFIQRLEKFAEKFPVFLDQKQEIKEIMAKFGFDKFDTISATVKQTLADSYPSDVVSAVFDEGLVYLYIPTKQNLFEVDIYSNLTNIEQYYKIYNELDSILSVIEHLNLDSNTGL